MYPGLVEQIEAGELDSAGTRTIIERALRPLLDQRVDTLVLACTHYPLVIDLIAEIAGPSVRVIDPSPAIARQTVRVLDDRHLRSGRTAGGALALVSSRAPEALGTLAARLIGEAGPAFSAAWDQGRLRLLG